jgi:nucleoside-diphosphate-sugar epimerase
MKITIIGTNGMLSMALTKFFYSRSDAIVDAYGLNAPVGYECTNFYKMNLLVDKIDYDSLVTSDIIIYASGAGVQASLKTDPSLMYALNMSVPVEITIQLKKYEYAGKFISFGSYMEIGLNDEVGKSFTETEIICSAFPVTNDYALSKRLFGRYMNDLITDYIYWHFILPNMFSEDDLKPGTRLVPYVLQYLIEYNKGRSPGAPSFSAGLQTRQYIQMEDILPVIEKSIESQMPSGVYNIGGGEFLSIRDVIERLFKAYNVPCYETFFGKEVCRDGDIKSLRIDGSKLQSAIDYLPAHKIEDILSPKTK